MSSSCDSARENLFIPIPRLDDDRDGTSSVDGLTLIGWVNQCQLTAPHSHPFTGDFLWTESYVLFYRALAVNLKHFGKSRTGYDVFCVCFVTFTFALSVATGIRKNHRNGCLNWSSFSALGTRYFINRGRGNTLWSPNEVMGDRSPTKVVVGWYFLALVLKSSDTWR